MECRFTILPINDPSSTSVIYKDRDVKEQLLQYNLDQTLTITRFRFTGQLATSSTTDYQELLQALFESYDCRVILSCLGEPSIPISMKSEALSLTTMNLSFFDRLTERGIVGGEGRIRGCFDDTFDGITVGDLLREMLVNENSENSDLFSAADRQEVIYQLFKLFAIGGELCQPDVDIEKYLTITKAVYKDLITVYRENSSQAVQVSGRAFLVHSVSGVTLHTHSPDSPRNLFLVIIDPMKRLVTVVKNSDKKFW